MTTTAIKQKRTRHSAQYKQQVVEQALSGNKPIAQLARELGLHAPQIHAWVARHKADQAQGREARDLQVELGRIKRENSRLQEELAILKKAAAYFARELK